MSLRLFTRKKWLLGVLFLIFMAIYTTIVLYIQDYLHHEDHNKIPLMLEHKKDSESVRNEEFVLQESLPPPTSKYDIKEKLNDIPKKKDCSFKRHQFFPMCQSKLDYLKYRWQERCFREVHGVDGSQCSILEYFQKAKMRFDLQGLLKILSGEQFQWMRQRATDSWPHWVQAGKFFQKKNQIYKRKKIALFMGSFGFQPLLFKYAGKGGPLGELVQWTDTLCGLYILGYDVNVYLNITEMNLPKTQPGYCAPHWTDEMLRDEPEVIYTDSNGMAYFIMDLGAAATAKYRCRLRLLDSFGTWPEYNDPSYPFEIMGGRSPWANMNLLTQQFLTLYPHTDDNLFLGFVVGSKMMNELPTNKPTEKQDKALLYAKLLSYCKSQENRKYLKIVSEYFQLEATSVKNENGFDFLHNYGPVSGSKVKELLAGAKVFIGCGFPYEGPGPLEAMAAGTPFIQPKYPVPKNKENDDFFKLKPNLRRLTSQSPYMEDFVGEPYVYTIDITNESLLRSVLQKIKNMKPLPPKIPKEFTNEGMMERLHIFTEHMDFCHASKPRWPPLSHRKVFVAEKSTSCSETCRKHGLVCEKSYFDELNVASEIEKFVNLKCSKIDMVFNLHAPSFDDTNQVCYLQKNTQFFSCSHRAHKQRQICPCRDFEKEQYALCNDCL
ncbi:alpha-1,6-mannosylglycoprotein 6-beta-N-acetylglucosaminyltransferase A-like isoform X2 [Clytia hemisphaerica]|uniref:alpha-1,6-mannosylglycoprotein 6-beta-N-acetylglucosaminyltransferase A-like isoform X2 n=1 Tax=Clytia hemisphaerica TaxID=252671 RepID=UPI0034D3AD86